MNRLPHPRRQGFYELVARGLRPADLAHAALLVACEEYPRMDPAVYLRRLDALGDEARLQWSRGDVREGLRVVNRLLFDEQGLRGNGDEYYDPRNSFLNEVLERRLGLPITLSIIYLHVASRAGLDVFAAGLPGHFMVAARDDGGLVYVDAFRGGRLLSPEQCSEFIASMFGGVLEWREEYASPLPADRTVVRLLYNLKGIYLRGALFEKALWVQDLLVALCPRDASELRDRGLVRAQLCQYVQARRDLTAYLESSPLPPEDAAAIERDLQRLRRLQQMLN